MNNLKIKLKYLKSSKKIVLNHFSNIKLRKKYLKPLKISKRFFFYHLKNFLKNTNKHNLLIEKLYKSGRENKKTKQKLSNILSVLLYNLKSKTFKNKQYFYKIKTILLNLFMKLNNFYSSNEYLLISLIKNLKNLPYSILIIYLNRYFRFCSIFKIILKISMDYFLSKIRPLNFKYLHKKINLKTLKNLMKYKLFTLKTKFKFCAFSKCLDHSLSYMENSFVGSFNIADQKVSKNELSRGFKKLFKLNLKKLSSKKIKPQLWKINRKLHTQNSFDWLFKKYWLILDSYKQCKFYKFKYRNLKLLYKKSNLIFSKNVLKKEVYISNSIKIKKILPGLRNFDNVNSILNLNHVYFMPCFRYKGDFDTVSMIDTDFYFMYTYYLT